MKYIMTESQFRFLTEQSDNWLQKWFEKVPEEKLKNTFVYFDVDATGKSKKTIFPDRKQILQIIKNTPIVSIDDELFKFLVEDDNTVGTYVKPDYAQKAKSLIIRFKSKIVDLKKKQTLTDQDKKMIQFYNNKIKRYETLSSYVGKVIVPNQIKKRKSDFGSTKDVLRHEQMHAISALQKSSAESIIRKICNFETCKKEFPQSDFEYLSNWSEVYSYLMELRSMLKMEPIDIIQDVKLEKSSTDNALVFRVTVLRDNKRINLSTTLKLNSYTFAMLECCTGDVKKSLQQLHNQLAITTPKQDISSMA